MAKKKALDNNDSQEPTTTIDNIIITPEHRQRILALVETKNLLKRDQEMFKEDVAGVAAAMGVKPADINEMVSIIIQEQEKGGVLLAKEKKLELARQILDGVLGDATHGAE